MSCLFTYQRREESQIVPLTKRKMLSAINSIYDLLGIAAPVVIVGKILYSKVCLLKLRWDQEVPKDVQQLWIKWFSSIKGHPVLSVLRSVVRTGLQKVVLHGFSNASKLAVATCIHAVSYHDNGLVECNLFVG